MPRSPLLEISPAEPAQMLVARRRARYGDLLALHSVLWCAEGRNPTEIATILFCSRSSVVPRGSCLAAGDPRPGAR